MKFSQSTSICTFSSFFLVLCFALVAGCGADDPVPGTENNANNVNNANNANNANNVNNVNNSNNVVNNSNNVVNNSNNSNNANNVTCQSSERLCGGTCVNTMTDSQNCGDCEILCGTSSSCEAGDCVCEGTTSDCNGDPSDGCECPEGCDGTQCAASTCTYEQENACGDDDSMWCSTVSDACVMCSEGFFNCNNQYGCECDSAGCNGEVCAGNCMSGLAEECP